jgi:hypothetical protein
MHDLRGCGRRVSVSSQSRPDPGVQLRVSRGCATSGSDASPRSAAGKRGSPAPRHPRGGAELENLPQAHAPDCQPSEAENGAWDQQRKAGASASHRAGCREQSMHALPPATRSSYARPPSHRDRRWQRWGSIASAPGVRGDAERPLTRSRACDSSGGCWRVAQPTRRSSSSGSWSGARSASAAARFASGESERLTGIPGEPDWTRRTSRRGES